MIGRTICHYRVLRKVGGGGMGEVYEAEDLKLGRHVALKFLSETRIHSAQALHRFEREARAASALNHPHICTIHEIAEESGEHFIVMELLQGLSLRDRLKSGALLLDDALQVAEQVVDALEAAHRAGIVHRDVTPSNIFITTSGLVKLLDFGLAKLEPEVPGGRAVAAELPTETAHMEVLTTPGALAGTVAYMSPEQVRGDPVDHRTDLFSLGVVVYETVTGTRPFAGKTSALIFDAILHAAPAPAPANLMPVALAQIIDKALEKDPRLRYQSVGEMKLDFQRMKAHAEARVSGIRRVGRLRRWAAAATASAAILTSIGAAAYFARRGADARPPSAVPRQLTTGTGIETEPAISPDSSTVAFTSDEAGNQDIWLVDVHGGPPQRLTTSPANDSHASWFPDGSAIAFVSDRNGQKDIFRVPRLDGDAATLLIENGDAPAISPDGSQIAFARAAANQYTRILVAPVANPSRARVITGDKDGLWDHMAPAWSPDGSLICYTAWDGLWIVPVAGGEPRHLTTQRQDGQPTWSADGRFVYFTSYRETAATLWRVPVVGGDRERVTMGSGIERSPVIDRQGRLLAFSTDNDSLDLVRIDRGTGQEVQFGTSSREDFPVFASDGRSVYFVSDRWGSEDIWNQPLSENGVPGTARRVVDQEGTKSQPDCSPDGKWLTYYRVVGNRRDVWVAPTQGGPPVRITDEPTGAVQPAWSPDGRKIAYVSERSGSRQIWVQPVADGGPVSRPTQITNEQRLYRFPSWSPDGSQLVFVTNGMSGGTEAALVAAGGGRIIVITRGARAARAKWDVTSGHILVSGVFEGHQFEIRAFDVNGERIGSSRILLGADRAAGLFNPSRDGRYIITARGRPAGDIWILESHSRAF